MAVKSKVTGSEAQACLTAIRKTFKSYIDALENGPVLIPDFDGRDWTIMWEEGAPHEWPFMLGGGVDEELSALGEEFGMGPVSYEPTEFPAGIMVEPINHISVGIYPA